MQFHAVTATMRNALIPARCIIARLAALLAGIGLLSGPVSAQQVTTLNVTETPPGSPVNDTSCSQPLASQIVRTFSVGSSFIVGDVDLGVFLIHTYRSDVRIFLTSPQGTTVTVMTWPGVVQGGDNLNDMFDDEAATEISAHDAGVSDPAMPIYSHSHRPSSPLSAFDGQNAAGTWTLRICDDVASDVGNFRQADLYLTSTSLSVSKTSSVMSDGISSSNPKALPGAIVQYCMVITNNGKATEPHATVPLTGIALTDALPAKLTYMAGSMRSGPNCAAATTVEDDNATGTDENDPYGMAITGSTITATAATLPPTASFALLFRATVN